MFLRSRSVSVAVCHSFSCHYCRRHCPAHVHTYRPDFVYAALKTAPFSGQTWSCYYYTAVRLRCRVVARRRHVPCRTARPTLPSPGPRDDLLTTSQNCPETFAVSRSVWKFRALNTHPGVWGRSPCVTFTYRALCGKRLKTHFWNLR